MRSSLVMLYERRLKVIRFTLVMEHVERGLSCIFWSNLQPLKQQWVHIFLCFDMFRINYRKINGVFHVLKFPK